MIVGTTHLVIGGLVALFGIPLALSWIRPNGLYGIHVEKTLTSPDAWYAVNRVAGLALLGYGAGIAAAGLLARLFDVSHPVTTVVVALVPGLLLPVLIVPILRALSRQP